MAASNSAGSGFAAAYGPDAHLPDRRVSHVLICDDRDARFQLTSRIVEECGNQPLRSSDYSTLDSLPLSRLALALVGLEEWTVNRRPERL